MGIESPPFFDITGGEFLLIDESELMSKMVRSNFPLTTIILESNGLLLLKKYEKYESIEFDRLHISIDVFHSNLNKGEKIIEKAMKLCENKGAKLIINHIPDDSGLNNEDCIERAKIMGIEINYFYYNTLARIGRGLNLSRTNKGQKVYENPSFFRCELGEAIFVNPDRNWYICHYPTNSTLIGEIGDIDLRTNYNRFLNSNLYKEFVANGLPTIYEKYCQKSSDYSKGFHNRCEPCIYLMDNKMLNFNV